MVIQDSLSEIMIWGIPCKEVQPRVTPETWCCCIIDGGSRSSPRYCPQSVRVILSLSSALLNNLLRKLQGPTIVLEASISWESVCVCILRCSVLLENLYTCRVPTYVCIPPYTFSNSNCVSGNDFWSALSLRR